MNETILKKAGIDYQAGVRRFMDDSVLYEAVLCAFVNDTVLDRARAAYRAGDMAKLLSAVHEAKGSSGNADIPQVFNEASALVLLLRSGNFTEDELTADFERFERAYMTMRDGIRAAMEV